MSKALKTSIIIVLSFCLALWLSKESRAFFGFNIEKVLYKYIYYYLSWIIPVTIAISFLFGYKNILRELKIDKGFKRGLLFGLIAVAPMFLGYAFVGKMSDDVSIITVLLKSFSTGFFEEMLFRAFLFGLLFRKAFWGFIPASILVALIFGLLHIYQGDGFSQSLGIFLITGMGAVWFAWLFIEWDENLWIPIFLHFLMNFSWDLFEVSDTGALGTYSSNIFRVITIALSIFITIWYKRKQKKDYAINKENLFVNKGGII